MRLLCSTAIIGDTLRFLHTSGQRGCEGIVLWLGARNGEQIHVRVAYQPEHRAQSDLFHIPPASMLQLKEYLRTNRLMIAAQVHSHPMEAFHSLADDKWAMVRHAGALSIVLPYFAKNTTTETFLRDAATFVLSTTNKWLLVPQQQVHKLCTVTR